MAESTVETETIKTIAKDTKRGFDPKERLMNRGLRRASIVLYLDEEKGVEIGWNDTLVNAMNQPMGYRREGVLGEIGEVQDTIDKLHRANSESILRIDKELTKAKQEAARKEIIDASQPLIDAAEEKLAELSKKRDDLIAELEATGMTIKIRAVPPVIQKDCRRKAKQRLEITGKNIPDDKAEEFDAAYTAELMAVLIQSIKDHESGEENFGATYEDAVALMEYLPPGQFARLDKLMGEVQTRDAISQSIESQEDFS